MLDEQLIKKEVQANRAASEEEKTKTIMSELIERQKNQKAIPTFFEEMSKGTVESVSYTHLTLPTILRV